jgi:N,N'-diacetyllegionaminate synthase
MFKNYHPDRCYIIAEIGGNFTTLEEARRLIDDAAISGVDAVKLQTYRADAITSKVAMFDMENTGVVSQHSLFKKYEINEELHRNVFEYAGTKNLDWFSTPSAELDVALLEKCGVGVYKIGSDDACNLPFLRFLARKGKPIILSTGMCTLAEVNDAVSAILDEGNKQLMLLHAVTSYPAHPENVNLRAIQTLIQTFPDLTVGYSDHTSTPIACLCAVAMGARIIERHFTFDKNADGPDHCVSSDLREMKWLVDAVRTFEVMCGSGIKQPAESEKTSRINNRKSIVLTQNVKAGEKISARNIAVKRPGNGIAPRYFDEVIGRIVGCDLAEDNVLQWENLA